MKLYTLELDGEQIVAAALQGSNTAYSIETLGWDYKDMNDLVKHADRETIAEGNEKLKLIAGAESMPFRPINLNDQAQVKICAPIEYPEQDVVCLGINYDEHAVEAGRFSDEAFGGERPYTIYFSKRVNRATATGEKIPAYTGLVDSLDYEAELGVILGSDAKGVKAQNAGEYVFGYTVINDVSARNLQTRHKQWYMGKSLDGFTPMGPCIVTADEITDVQNLNISSMVNGELRQSSNTKYMIQTVGGAIEELSQGMTLKAGTIIATGTPAGVGMGMTPPTFLKPGDVVVCEIEKIGHISNAVE